MYRVIFMDSIYKTMYNRMSKKLVLESVGYTAQQ